MSKVQQKHYQSLYKKHVNALKRQGKSKSTIGAYLLAIRRIAKFFDRCPDKLTVEDLKDYFSSLVKTHSWSAVKVDRNGLQFFYKQVLGKNWKWVDIVKPPVVKTLPDILTHDELTRLINSARECRYQVFIHSRRLDYHPHLHVVIPGGCLNKKRRQWKRMHGKYLFNEFNLAIVFRAKMLEAIKHLELPIPSDLPIQWVVGRSEA